MVNRRDKDQSRTLEEVQFLMHLWQIIRDAVWHHHWMFVIVFAIFFIPGAVFIAQKPNLYQASVSMLIEPPARSGFDDIGEHYTNSKISDSFIETQRVLIASPSLLAEVVEKLELPVSTNETPSETPAQIVERLESQLFVLRRGNSLVIDVGFNGKDPKQVATLANELADSFVARQRQTQEKQITQVNRWLTDQIDRIKEQTISKSRQVEEFRDKVGIIKGRNSGELFYQQISEVAAELIPIESRRLELEARYNALKQSNNAAGSSEIINSSLIQNLKREASQLSQELSALSETYREEHPEYQKVKQRYDQVRRDIQNETGDVLSSIKRELESARIQENTIRAKLTRLKSEAGLLETKRVGLDNLRQEESASQKLLDSLLEGYGRIQTQLELPGNHIRVISYAIPPHSPYSPRRGLLFVVLLLLSGIVAFLSIVGLDLLQNRIRRAEDIQKVLKLRLVGLLPSVNNPAHEVLAKERTHYLSELRRVYLYLTRNQGAQSVLITSSYAGEGKTTIATALCYFMRTLGKKVVLIESDAFELEPVKAKGSGHSTQEEEASTNLPHTEFIGSNALQIVSEALKTGTDVSAAIRKDETGVDILPLGDGRGDLPEELLFSGNFKNLLTQLKQQYDFIIIDSSAIMVSTDAEILGGMVDHIMIVTHWNKTTKRQLRKASRIVRRFTEVYPAVILNRVIGKSL